MKTILQLFDQVTPVMVRGLCRKSISRIAADSGLSANTVCIISRRKSWAGIKVGVMDRFCRACGHDPLNPEAAVKVILRFASTGEGLDWMSADRKKHLLRKLLS